MLIYSEEGTNHQSRNVRWTFGNKWWVPTQEEKICNRDFGIIQVKAELNPWKWMRSLKEKLDSKKNEQVKVEHRGIFIIIIQAEKKDLERKMEILKRVAKYTFLLAWIYWCFSTWKKRDRYA